MGPARRYFQSCFLLLLPVLLFNAGFAPYLPDPFFESVDLPTGIVWGENLGRILVFGLPALMPLRPRSTRQKVALAAVIAGELIYMGLWLPLLLSPDSEWSRSWYGFLAPAYAPALFLMPLALVARRFVFPLPYRPAAYWLGVSLFLICHNVHVLNLYVLSQ